MKILLAEDDPSIQAIAIMALERVGKHTVIVTSNGKEAFETATTLVSSKLPPDLIVLDVMMPKIDGFKTIVKLKESEATKSIPVIFLTAKAQTHEIQKGMGLGAIGYILKPFDPMTLHLKIAEVIKTHAEKAAAA